MAKRKVSEIRKAANEHIDARMKSLELSKQEFESVNNITSAERQRYENLINLQKEQVQLEALKNEYAKDYNELTGIQKKARENDLKAHRDNIKGLEKELNIVEKTNKELKNKLKWHQKIGKTIKELDGFIGGSNIWKFLMESDKGIKKTALQLGLSGERSDILRGNIEQSAQYAARMGVSVTELSEAQATYVEETGRALMLNEQSLKAITQMAKGTGLGVQDATKLAAQFELIGINAVTSAEKVQGIVDQSERMGVSATKMLKKVSENFEAINRFAFRDGVDSFAKMAMYAEKFKVDMGSMLDSADRARTLEGAIEMAAELQVMGGEFAKTDPFELLFLSRNDPEKYQKKINNMTKGIATFRKNSEGAFEAYISPMDLDRLDRAGKALGISGEELAKQSKQMLKMRSISSSLIGTGISKEDREMISGMAELNTKTGEYVIQLKDGAKSVKSITADQLGMLRKQSKDLEQRSLDSKTFDEAWQNTIMEFKATLLPMIKGINEALQSARPFISTAMDWFGGMMKGLDGFMVKAGFVVAGIVTASRIFQGVAKTLGLKKAMGKIWEGKGGAGGAADAAGGTGPVQAAKKGGKHAGKGMLRGGAGVGAAALGVGAGIGAAALGIAELAKAMKDLDTEQLNALMIIAGGIVVLLPALSMGLIAVAGAAALSAKPLIALGVAVALIGAGIGVAAAGIGYMAQGIATLGDSKVASNLVKTGEGLTSIMGAFSSGLFSGGISEMLSGLGKFATVKSYISDFAESGEGMKNVGYGFEQIAAVMNGDISNLNAIKDTVKSISEMDMGNSSAMANLAKLLSQPLTVKFAEDGINLAVNATLELDGDVLYRKVMKHKTNITQENDARNGDTAMK